MSTREQKAARARMKQTGERYTTALAAVRRERQARLATTASSGNTAPEQTPRPPQQPRPGQLVPARPSPVVERVRRPITPPVVK